METGKVKAIVEVGRSDAVFLLEENDPCFYINRGIDEGGV